jgi:hypothetical protein
MGGVFRGFRPGLAPKQLASRQNKCNHTPIPDRKSAYGLVGWAYLLCLTPQVGHILYLDHPFADHARLSLHQLVAFVWDLLLCHGSAAAFPLLSGPHNILAAADIHFLFLHSCHILPRQHNPGHIRCHTRHTHIPVGIAHNLVEDTAVVLVVEGLAAVEPLDQSRCRGSAAERSKIGWMPY